MEPVGYIRVQVAYIMLSLTFRLLGGSIACEVLRGKLYAPRLRENVVNLLDKIGDASFKGARTSNYSTWHRSNLLVAC